MKTGRGAPRAEGQPSRSPMSRSKIECSQRLGRLRSGPFAVLALLLVALATAGCSYGRAVASRHATPPDPPPVPRAKPIATAIPNPPAVQSAAAQDAPSAAVGPRIHTVTEGQSLYAIARLYDVSMPSLIQTNRLAPPYKLAIGQRLVVPDSAAVASAQAARTEVVQGQLASAQVTSTQDASGQVTRPVQEPLQESVASPAAGQAAAPAATHVVESGDTVYSIARRYQVDMADLVRLNTIPKSYFISPGQRLLLPAGGAGETDLANKLAPGTTKLGSAEASAQTTAVAWTSAAKPAATVMPPPAVTGPIPDAPPRSSDRFLWPVQGELLVDFGPKQGGLHNDGINIAAPRGSPVLAAENGVVAYVGNELRGFGNLLLIKHDGGWMTAYAHNEEILVGRGARVKRGQTVARVGDSGSVVTPQLHFEIRRGTRAVDPAKLLSPPQSAQKM